MLEKLLLSMAVSRLDSREEKLIEQRKRQVRKIRETLLDPFQSKSYKRLLENERKLGASLFCLDANLEQFSERDYLTNVFLRRGFLTAVYLGHFDSTFGYIISNTPYYGVDFIPYYENDGEIISEESLRKGEADKWIEDLLMKGKVSVIHHDLGGRENGYYYDMGRRLGIEVQESHYKAKDLIYYVGEIEVTPRNLKKILRYNMIIQRRQLKRA